MLPQAKKHLLSQRLKTGLSGYVFTNKSNKHYNNSFDLKYEWKKILKECNFKYSRFIRTKRVRKTTFLDSPMEQKA